MEKFPPPTPRAETRVLIIDNQALVHDVIKSALAEIGISKVSSALNAFHALRLCDQTRFDFILIAFNISHDKDGFHLFEELKHHQHITEKTTVIFLSAETGKELVNCIVEMQPDDFWVKPLDNKRIVQRLIYLLECRKRLNKLYHCLYQRNFAAAIYHAERQLNDPKMGEFHPRLKRIVGNCLLQLREFSAAETYFVNLLATANYAWVHIGLARSLLKQGKNEEAELLVEDLLERSDTRFLTYDLLAQYYVEKEQFEQAHEQMKQASKLAPRNIERNKRLWDLARLNHDKTGQLIAVQNMARYAKNSIHDSPELTLHVIRAIVDLATGASTEETERLLKRVEVEIDSLKKRAGVERQLEEQLTVIQARILCLRNEKKSAEAIMKNRLSKTASLTMEDNLDKMKAFHELGMKEQCLTLLDQLRLQIAGDTFSGQVVDEYLKQESIERREISFTTKELKQMAAVNYKENRILPAYNNLRQAFTLSPRNQAIALSILKVLAQISKNEALTHSQMSTAQQAVQLTMADGMSNSQLRKRDEFLRLLGIELEATNDAAAPQIQQL